MVPCFICQTPVTDGWICGPPPAADRYKLGLCPVHDTPVNREQVLAAWEEAIQRELRAAMPTPAAGLPLWHEVTVQFLDGGHLTLTCSAYEIDHERDTLCCRAGEALEFIPLQHVRRIRAVPRPDAPPSTSPPTG